MAGPFGTAAIEISGNNIVGFYTDASGNSHGFLATVPEPSTFALAVAAFGGLMLRCRFAKNRTIVVLAALLWATAVSPSLAITYTTINYPGSSSTVPRGIDGNNIVGVYNSSPAHGFLYNGTTYTTLDDPLATQGTYAFGISGGNIVGSYKDSSNKTHGFLYNGSTYTTFDPPGSTYTEPDGIFGGNIVGQYNDSSFNEHGFLYNGTTYTTLDDPLGTNGTQAHGISGNNIVGTYVNSAFLTHGFLYNGSTYTPLDDPLGATTYPFGISGSNIVGFSESRTFLYNGTTYTTLDDPLGTNGTQAYGVSGNNIVGTYTGSSGNLHGFLATVPEPSSMALAALGLFGVVVFARRSSQIACIGRLVLIAVVAMASARTSFAITYTTIDFPGSHSTTAIETDGSNIVGEYDDSSLRAHGFLYNGSTYTTLDDPLATGTLGTFVDGISGGNIVGEYYSSNVPHGFLYNGSTYTTLDDPLGTKGTEATGISGGNIVGDYYDSSNVQHGFLYNGSTYTTLDNPLGTKGTIALGISGGNIVGEYFDSSNVQHGFRYNGTTYTTLDDPLETGPIGSIAENIDGNNIVGDYNNATGVHGFLYNGTTFTTLDDPLAGPVGTRAFGISGDNIVGVYTDASGSEHGFLATVPEPGTFVLATLGFLGVIAWRRRCLVACVLFAAAALAVSEARADIAYAWGYNVYGQLGDGTTTTRSTPAPVTGLTSGVTAVAAGGNYSLAVQNGRVYAWGTDEQGELGDGSLIANTTTPVVVPGLASGVTAIAGGSQDGLALQNGGVYTWGINGTGGYNLTPVAVSGLSGVTAIAGGGGHNLALQNGGAFAWGKNLQGQLGDGTATSRTTPLVVSGLSSGVTAIAAGANHSLAVHNGGAYAWGWNSIGQLGDGTTIDRSTPIAVPGLSTGVTSIAGGEYFSLAVRDGGVYAWGSSFYGQLGDGTTNSQLTPEHIDPADLHNITEVAAAGFSSYALSSDGSLWVWGHNGFFALGLGNEAQRLSDAPASATT